MQGTIQSTSVSTDMAINGDGWFVVAQPTGFTDNQPVFNGVNDYTRAGDFQLNQNGNLVNGAGYYLMGIPVNATTGNPVGSVPQVLQFNNNFVPAQETTAIQYQANLPSTPTSGMLESERVSRPTIPVRRRGKSPVPGRRSCRTRSRPGRARSWAHRRHHAGVARNQLRRHDTVSDGTNTTTYTVDGRRHDRRSDDRDQRWHARMSARRFALSGGNLVLTGTTAHRIDHVGGTAAADLGFGAGTTTLPSRPIC